MDTTVKILKGRKILQYTYGILPIVAGLNKFTNILAGGKIT